MQKRLECEVSGRVQMVMFRDFVSRKAKGLGILGSVKNNKDGTVSVVAEGDEAKLNELLAHIKKGPVLARVDAVSENWCEYLGEYKNFAILY